MGCYSKRAGGRDIVHGGGSDRYGLGGGRTETDGRSGREGGEKKKSGPKVWVRGERRGGATTC